ncbi:MAG: hypothetical protein H9864_07485, partial [Candidatus Faecalibacterium intestinavium]|nr:hypothetical protein [Candidatus Faecalibacterium intestinavium]
DVYKRQILNPPTRPLAEWGLFPLALDRFFRRGKCRLQKSERGASNGSLYPPQAAVAIAAHTPGQRVSLKPRRILNYLLRF